MEFENKATSLWRNFFNLRMPQIRAFHMTWFAFFLCFFAWFGIAPLMKVVREELSLTQSQVGWCIIASVTITVLARLLIGWACDRYGPRLAYTWLLLLGSLPVMGIGLAHDFATFLLFRVLIGAIGASFVITQYHTSLMFAPNCVGTANATTAGWGNLGGGVTQLAMPLLFAAFVGVLGFSDAASWRLSLFVTYGCCFGIEITIENIIVLYFLDYFNYFKQMDAGQAMKLAGFLASFFGLMNIFARSLGGWLGDKAGNRWGLSGRVKWLFVALFCEGVALLVFSQATTLTLAIPLLILFGLFVKMSNGATYAVVPFVNRRALGAVAGIVGAGGNAGAVLAGFLLKAEALNWPTALFILGALITACSFLSFAVTLREEEDAVRAFVPAREPGAGELVAAG